MESMEQNNVLRESPHLSINQQADFILGRIFIFPYICTLDTYMDVYETQIQ